MVYTGINIQIRAKSESRKPPFESFIAIYINVKYKINNVQLVKIYVIITTNVTIIHH